MKPTKEQLYADYIERDMTLKQIGEKYGIAFYSVDYYRNLYGIATRGKARTESQRLSFTEEQKQIIIGTLLGDGHLEAPKTSFYPRLQVEHGIQQKEYVEWLQEKMNPFSKALNVRLIKAREIKGVMVKSDKESIRFRTGCHPELTEYYDLFYPEGKKQFSAKVFNRITDLGLSIWYMDDGVSCHDKALEICTGILPEDQQDLVKQWFFDTYGIESRIRYTHNGGYRIKFINIHAKKLAQIMYPHFCPSMLYKIQSLV